MAILTIVIQKGSVGKTTIAVLIAHRLALAGKHPLRIDLTAQGRVGLSLSLPIAKRMIVVPNLSMTIYAPPCL